MHAQIAGRPPVAFDLKSTTLPLVALVLKTADLADLAASLEQRFRDTPNFFDADPVVIDLSQVNDDDQAIDFDHLAGLIREYKMVPVAVRSGSAAQMQAALAAGLGAAPEVAREERKSAAAQGAAANDTDNHTASEPQQFDSNTLVIDKPLRSGQRVYARGGDLVVLALVSFDAEVIADGNVHVYAPLRGKAMAGARGNGDARIFTTCFEPQLVSIAGIYRTNEIVLPQDVLGKPAKVRLEGERIVMEPLGR